MTTIGIVYLPDVMNSVGATRSDATVIQYLYIDSCMITSHLQSFKQKINNNIGRRLVMDNEIFSYISHSRVDLWLRNYY